MKRLLLVCAAAALLALCFIVAVFRYVAPIWDYV